jgi:hypothetical protein
MFPVRYELGFTSQKTAFFIVTAVKASNLTDFVMCKTVTASTMRGTDSYAVYKESE